MSIIRKIQRHILRARGVSGQKIRLFFKALRADRRAGAHFNRPAPPHPEMHAPDPTFRKPKRKRSLPRPTKLVRYTPQPRRITRAEKAQRDADLAAELLRRIAGGKTR